ncbi:5-amino-6-(5-phospho-D-ribitylamino)uracil phosphatase YcsE [bioreactor metagenome]|uniref:5-amino-6-(5-phospho-D-ribitylamino)uracil phosphatase YcsE n=1 Tax=bioreactor metagenome TaxID=1076179 RepID=A0A645AZR4_9ZZZZ
MNRFVVSCESTGLFRIVQDDLRQRFGTYFEFNQSAKDLMDVTPAGIDKGTAVKEVLKLLGYDRLEAAAIGDSYNDIAMLEAVGTSFAMASGEEITKRTADHVVHDLAEAVAMIIKNT